MLRHKLFLSSASSSLTFSCSAVSGHFFSRRFSAATNASVANSSSSSSSTTAATPTSVDVMPCIEGDSSARGRLERTVSSNGFHSVLCDTLLHSAEIRRSEEFQRARQLAADGGNILLTGPANTGKRSVMVELVQELAKDEHFAKKVLQKKKNSSSSSSSNGRSSSSVCTALISMRAGKACSMPHGMFANPFLGVKNINSSTPFEQLCSAMQRHIRLMRSAYAHCLPSVSDVDVLGIDSLEDMPRHLFRALDHVCREVRQRPDEPFGGIQVIAAANFWRMSEVDQSSPHGVYVFQTESFFRAFPADRTILMHRFVHRDNGDGGEDNKVVRTKLDDYTINALFGNLPADVEDFERLFAKPNLPYQLPLQSVHALQASSSNSSSHHHQHNQPHHHHHHHQQLQHVQTVEFAEYVDCSRHMFPAFCRHPAKRDRTYSLGKVNSRFLSWLAQHFYLSHNQVLTLGLPNKLNVSVNDVVMFTRDHSEGSADDDDSSSMIRRRHQQQVRKGALGTVVGAGEHALRVQMWGGERRVVSVRPMRFETRHSVYPALRENIQQYPIIIVRQVYPDALVQLNIAPEACVADARFFTEINELGNFLALLRRPGNVHFTHVRQFLERPACIHEAAKNYYESLIETNSGNSSLKTKKTSNSNNSKDIIAKNCFGTMPYRSDLDNRLCKNCKKHVPAAEFAEHWLECVQSCRWCTECSATVPIEKWEAHNEKHTVVMCLDCGRALEWRNWALHRNTCGAMIREVSANNELLPSVTQQTALHMGVDTRDLHSVKQIKKGGLPKSGRDIARGHKTSFQYKVSH